MSRRTYITNAIPYVNGDPHIGHALEFVQTDVIARHRRLRGESVRYLSGTDDNAFKNVRAAEAAGVPVARFVAERAHAFAALREPLQLSYDDFIRTSTDRRHRPGVERLWNACRAAGDLYEREYSGLYCAGCEAFVSADDLEDGLCVEHGVPPETVTERNWFFALSRYRDLLLGLLESGQLDVRPAHRRNEVLSLVRGGLEDFSVSRPAERAHGWGIPVPGDAGQVIYVWFDALANYITALGYGQRAEPYATWWEGADDRVHLVGKGITRFHAVYWPAILLSAGEPLPTTVVVHDYLTVEGRKISKSAGTSAHPATLVDRYGGDALRWWLLRDVPPSGDADFREHQLGLRANELADGLGNLVNRTIALSGKYDPDLGAPLAGGDQRAAQLELLAAGLPPPSTRRSAGSTCGPQAARYGMWSMQQTPTSRIRGRGSSAVRRPTTRAPVRFSTRRWRFSIAPAGASPASSRPSFQRPADGSWRRSTAATPTLARRSSPRSTPSGRTPTPPYTDPHALRRARLLHGRHRHRPRPRPRPRVQRRAGLHAEPADVAPHQPQGRGGGGVPAQA
jgi:methionyl-tRNA synthetase